MTADLPPEVQRRAAEAADKAHHESDIYDGWARWLGIVDAVTVVVAEEIERPLQARIEELEDQRAELLERCRQADLSKALPDLSTGEVRRALGIPPLGGPDA